MACLSSDIAFIAAYTIEPYFVVFSNEPQLVFFVVSDTGGLVYGSLQYL